MFKVSQAMVDKLHRRESRHIQANLRARQLNLEKAFPHKAMMVGIPWSSFSKIGRIPRSDEAAELLVDFTPATMEAVFVSHEWWVRPPSRWAARVKLDGTGKASLQFDEWDGAAQPDYPDGHEHANLKYIVVCNGISELVKRGVLDSSKEPLIWLDWFSVDQVDAENRDDALDSMCHYVSMCKVLLIPTQQEEATIRASCPKELEGFGSRCWCRCEVNLFAIASELLAASQGTDQAGEGLRIFAASRSGALNHLPRTTWSAALPVSGELSVEADRAHVEGMHAMALDAYARTHVRRACRAAQKQKVRKVEGGTAMLGASQLCDGHMEPLAARLAAGDLDAAVQIDLSHNHLTDAGMEKLATALKAHPLPKLETLNLRGNPVTEDGRQALARVVTAGCKLL